MSSSKSIKWWLDFISSELKEIDRSRREAQLLLMAFLEVDELYLMMHEDEKITESSQLESWVQRRALHEPLEYILENVSFYSQNFFIKKGALIPRPETELLIDEVIKECERHHILKFAEVGIGSGIISIILAQHFSNASFIGVDISSEALEVARKNIEEKKMSERITLYLGSLLEPVSEKIDVLVSNPPYIAKDAVLESNLDYEPDLALFGGEEGDELIKELLDQVLERQIPLFICEFGYDQRLKVQEYLKNDTRYKLRFYKDLAGFDRGFILKLKKQELS